MDMGFEEAWAEASPLIQMNKDEARELWEQAVTLGEGRVIVEIGTLKGGSAIMLASRGSHVHTVDIVQHQEVPVNRFTQIIGKSTNAATEWKLPIDLLLIDGDHHYESVREDLVAWLRHVRAGGIILFHDYDSHLGVTKAVHEAIEGKSIELVKKVGSLLITRK